MASVYPHLDHAPIREAILDINVEAKATIQEADEFAASVSGFYPTSFPLKTTKALIIQEAAQTPLSHSTVGKICWNADKTRAVQARLDGFTANHVRTYESWEALRSEAQRFWGEYVRVFRPAKVRTVGLRYINLIALPSDEDLAQHVETRPSLGEQLPQKLLNYFMRVEVPFSSTRRAVITQTTAPPDPDGKTRGMILDVHAVSTQELDPGSIEIWNELDRLREIKNKCFFGSLRERTWRQYL